MGSRTSRPASPPRLAVWLAGLRQPADDREFSVGDLIEEFHDVVVPLRGPWGARRWFWRQALRCLLGRRPAFGPAVPRRPIRPASWLADGVRDCAYAFRLMRRTPLVAGAAVLTFALGIGANIAIFSVARPVLVDALPFPDEQHLTAIWLTYPLEGGGVGRNPVKPADYAAMTEARSFTSVEAYGRAVAEGNLVGDGEPTKITVGSVTPGFFSAMGVTPIVGRPLMRADADAPGTPLVITESLWASAFNGDPGIAGRPVRLDGVVYDLVGVVPDWSGLGTRSADAWTLLEIDSHIQGRLQAYYLAVVGRLRPGATLASANEELAVIMAREAAAYPETNGDPPLGALAVPFREELTGPVRPTFLILIGGSAAVLLMAGINLIGLQLVRQSGRQREFAVRQAVGASRLRLVRLLLVESLAQAMLGALGGLIGASLTLSILRRVAPPGVWYEIPSRPSPAVVLFALALAVFAGFVVGLWPALRGAAASSMLAIRSRASLLDRATARGRTAMVTLQVALTLILLIVAMLVGTSLARVLRIDPGFRSSDLLIADFSLPQSRYPSAEAASRFYADLTARVDTLPGADRTCVISDVPLDNTQGNMTWVAEGDPNTRRVNSIPKVGSRGCFATFDIPLLAGDLFESASQERQVVLSHAMARALWPDEPADFNPVGRRIHMGTPDGWLMTVIGMVGDIRNGSLESGFTRQVWLPPGLGLWPPKRLVVRANDPAATTGLAAPIRGVLRELDGNLALANIRTMATIIADATAPRRFVLLLLGGFAVVAALLAAVGIYGVLAHQVGLRTPEIGLRRALGARGGDVLRLIVGRVGLAVLVGTLVGLAGAAGVSRFVAGLLFDVSATDAPTYAIVTLGVMLVAAAAAWPPIRRALRVDPLKALRAD